MLLDAAVTVVPGVIASVSALRELPPAGPGVSLHRGVLSRPHVIFTLRFDAVSPYNSSGSRCRWPLARGSAPTKSSPRLAPAAWARSIARRDTKLNREVAIKILPRRVRRRPDRLARFQREAKMLASLNHPNIAAHLRPRRAGGVTRARDGTGRGRGLSSASPAGRSRSTRRCRSRGRSPRRSKRRTSRGSSIAI